VLKEILNRPYYFEENPKRRWRIVAFISLFVLFFLSVFQPFQLSIYPGQKMPLFLSYAAITFFITTIFEIILPRIAPKWFTGEQWTTGKELVYLLSMIFFIGFGNTLFSAWMGFLGNFWMGLMTFEIYTFAVALFPILFLVFITEKLDNQKHEWLSTTLMTQKQSIAAKTKKIDTIKIIASNEKVALEIAPKDIFYFKSEANYIEIIYQGVGKLEKTLLRNTLTAMEQQFQEFDHFFRCHKSYMVNLSQIERISGNAQGLKIHFEDLKEIIPVSRKYNDVLKEKFNKSNQ